MGCDPGSKRFPTFTETGGNAADEATVRTRRGDEPSTPGRHTVIPPDRETWDLICAYLAGELSEGRLRDILCPRNGWRGDEVRAAWYDAVERGTAAARWRSPSGGPVAPTPDRPASSSGPHPS